MSSDERQSVLQHLLELSPGGLPQPLEVTLLRLQRESQSEDPLSAIWALRDAFECLIKFTTGVVIADRLRCDPVEENVLRSLAQLLDPERSPSIGTWATTLFANCRAGSKSGLLFPDLTTVFYKDNRQTKQARSVSTYVAWRNRTVGHGVFGKRSYYRDALFSPSKADAPGISGYTDTLTSVGSALGGWTLQVDSIRDELKSEREARQQQHEGQVAASELTDDDSPHKLNLVRGEGDHRSLFNLLFFLCARGKAGSSRPRLYFFDKWQPTAKTPRRTSLLNYEDGDWWQSKENDLLAQVLGCLPREYKYERIAIDQRELSDSDDGRSEVFSEEFVSPDHIVTGILNACKAIPKGYIHLVGQSGVGKTFCLQGLERSGMADGIPVITYQILANNPITQRTHTFAMVLGDKPRARKSDFPFVTNEIQLKTVGRTVKELQHEFCNFLHTLIESNRATGHLEGLVLAIDGLDAVPDPIGENASIVDFLPPADQLPQQCWLLLSSQRQLQPYTRNRIIGLRQDTGSDGWREVEFDHTSVAHESFLTSYLSKHLPDPLKTNQRVHQAILERAGRLTLFVFHFTKALQEGAFWDVEDLPDAKDFYSVYLNRLRDEVGQSVFDRVFLRLLLLLVVAQSPVNREMLIRWGIPAQHIDEALQALRDFLRSTAGPRYSTSFAVESGERVFALAHNEFVKFVHSDPGFSQQLRALHREIAATAKARGWKGRDLENAVDLYEVMYTANHNFFAGQPFDVNSMVRDTDWLLAINEIAFRAHREGRYELAASSFDLLLQLAFQIATHSDDSGCLRSLALYLSYFASSLVGMDRVEEAMLYFQMAQAWYLNGLPLNPNERQSAELVHLFGNMAIAFGRIGRLEHSIEIYTKCADELERNGGDPLLLAHVLTNRSHDYGVIGKLDEALADANLAIQLVENSSANSDSIRADDTRAQALQNKAVALLYQNRHVESLEYSRQARVHWEGRVKTTPDLFPEFARSLLNEAMCHRGLGHDLDAAARVCRHCISILETECVERGRTEFRSELAMAHNTLGNALSELGDYEQALIANEAASSIRRQELESGLGLHAQHGLAHVLENRWRIFERVNKIEDAIAVWDELVVLYDAIASVLAKSGTTSQRVAETWISWGETLLRAGIALRSLGRQHDALTKFRLVSNRYPIGQISGNKSDDLALRAAINEAAVLGDLGNCDESIVLYGKILESENQVASSNVSSKAIIATAYTHRANQFSELHRHQEALMDYANGIERLEVCLECDETTRELEAIALALHNRSVLHNRVMQEAAVSDGESMLINTEHVVRCVEDATRAFQFYQKIAMRSGYNKTSWAWSQGAEMLGLAGVSWLTLRKIPQADFCLRQAEDILRGLIQASPTSEQALSLINILLQRHSLSQLVSDPVTAGQTIDEAKLLVEQFRRSVPLKIAASISMYRGMYLANSGKSKEAESELANAIELFSSAARDGDQMMLTTLGYSQAVLAQLRSSKS